MMLEEFAARYELRPREILACGLAGCAAAAGLLVHLPLLAAALSGYLLFTMLLVTIIDSRMMIIPDIFSLPAIPLGFAATAAIFPEAVPGHAIAAAVAAGFLYGLRWIYLRIRGVIGLGLGDVKLAAAAGAWVGLEHLPFTCLLATGAALTAVLVQRVDPASLDPQLAEVTQARLRSILICLRSW